jgi:hypothetical protein
MKAIRNAHGATTGLVVALLFVFTTIIVGFFQISLYFFGADDTRNATDSGALKVGQKSLTISTTAQNSIEHQFDDVADSKGNFNLTNINRVWGKAMLASLNVAAMYEQGYGSSEANSHSDALFQAAQSISDRLANKLSTPKNHHAAFTSVTDLNSLNSLGEKTKLTVAENSNWTTSFVDRGSESNLEFDKDQLPAKSQVDTIGPVTGQDGKQYIPGYKAMKFLQKTFYLVPFKAGERPHLISAEKYNNESLKAKPIKDWRTPVPNAFSVGGKTINQDNLGQTAIAYVQTNPQRKFDLGIPRAFIRIRLEKNTVRYIHNQMPRTSMNYAFRKEEQIQVFDAGAGVAHVTASLGNEYTPPTLHQAIYALPGDHSEITRVLLQRCREIKRNIKEAELMALLQIPLVNDIDEYLIFPLRKDFLVVMPLPNARGTVPGLDFLAKADGNEKEIATEIAPLVPNSATVRLVGSGQVTVPPTATTIEHGHLKWKPGSGYEGCLGELSIERDTEILSFGFMVP